MEEVLKRALVARVGDVLPSPTPLDEAPNLADRIGHRVLLKREDLTPVFSFKLRGAYNRIAQLTRAELDRGVITASAGNHAQGVAYGARRLGAEARIVMPRTTPSIKVRAVQRFGGVVDLVGDSYSEAAEHCARLIEETGAAYVPPFDDLDVIAGQATVGLEVLSQAPRDLGAVYVPIGGGGLAAGVAAVIKELAPHIRVVGVQSADSDAMRRSIEAGRVLRLDHVGIFADGVAVKQVGELTLDLCTRYLDDIVCVTTDETCAAIQDAFEDTRSVLEPAGALSLAGLKRDLAERAAPSGPAVAVASGANIPFAKIGYVAERAELGERREAIFAVTIPERAGAFLDFCRVVGDRSVTEFNYRLGSRERAHLFVGVEVASAAQVTALCDAFASRGYSFEDLTNDELSKIHLRHMVGGRAAEAEDELLFTFEFPERPGALLQFLENLGSKWNISLFHYRNHGSAFGRVFCGFEVPPAERAELRARLDALGFEYEDVTGSAAARFLLHS